jgi:predicted MFS family arabinose efflux permease
VNPFAGRIGVEASELRWFFPVVGLVIACSLIFLAPVQAPPLAGAKTPLVWRDALRALRARPLWPVWFATGVFASLVSVFMSFTTVVAEARGLEDPAVAWFSYAGGAVLVRAVGASVPERVGLSRILAPALGAYVVAMGLVAVADSTSGFLLAGALAGFGHGYCFPVLTAQTVSRSPVALRGSALSLFTALWDVAKLAVVPAMGLLADWGGDGAMLWTCCLAGAVGGVVWAVMEWRTVIIEPANDPLEAALP